MPAKHIGNAICDLSDSWLVLQNIQRRLTTRLRLMQGRGPRRWGSLLCCIKVTVNTGIGTLKHSRLMDDANIIEIRKIKPSNYKMGN